MQYRYRPKWARRRLYCKFLGVMFYFPYRLSWTLRLAPLTRSREAGNR